MSRNPVRSLPKPRRRRFRSLFFALAALVGVVLAVAPFTLDLRAPAAGAPDAGVAREALAAGEALRGFVQSGGSDGRIALSIGEIDALLASGARLAPGVWASARIEHGRVVLEASLGAPYLPAGVRADMALGLAANAGGLRIATARLGWLPLPARLVQAAAVRLADRVLGPGLAAEAMAGVVGIDVEDERVEVAFGFTPAERGAQIERLRTRLRVAAGGPNREPIYAQLYWLDRSGDAGDLPRRGSVLPYLGHALDRAAQVSERFPEVSDHDHAAAALLALALYCGEPALGAAVGVTLNPRMAGDRNHCNGATLAARDDLKRHFFVSAGLYAASTGSAALGIGELKELVDSGGGGSGFSFDDMAANLAGARFAARFLAAPKADWPALAASIRTEGDVMPAVADLPRGLGEAEFRSRFGDVDSPAYRAMLAEITARIDELPFHRTMAGG